MKKLQKLNLLELQDYNAISNEEQKMLKGGNDPSTWTSWDDIPDGTQWVAVADATYVYVDNQYYEFQPGCSSNQWQQVASIGSASPTQIESNQTVLERYNEYYENNPNPGGPFPPGSLGYTIMQYMHMAGI